MEEFDWGHGNEKERRDKGMCRALEADEYADVKEKKEKGGELVRNGDDRSYLRRRRRSRLHKRPSNRDGVFHLRGVIRGAHSLDIFFLSNFDNSQASSSSVQFNPALPQVQ